jgi:hypothetical protein
MGTHPAKVTPDIWVCLHLGQVEGWVFHSKVGGAMDKTWGCPWVRGGEAGRPGGLEDAQMSWK